MYLPAQRIVALPFVQTAVANQHVGAAAHPPRQHVKHLLKTRESAFEFQRRKMRAETNFAPNVFQVSILPRTKGVAVSATILDGRSLARDLRAELTAGSSALRDAGTHPRLVVVLVGRDESSIAYVRNLVRTGEKVGITVDVEDLPESASAGDVRARLERLAGDPTVHGAMLQQPLPAHLSIRAIADAIPVNKDVDGTHPTNQGHLAFGSGTTFVPATPAAVMLLLERSPHWPLKGRRAVMIGRSVVVGLPVAMLLMAQHATVTVLHKESGSLQPLVKMADVVIVATGVPGLIKGNDIASGATIIDVGTTMVDGILKGDVDFESARLVAGAISPVPGGVGPVTNVALLRNVIKSASRLSSS